MIVALIVAVAAPVAVAVHVNTNATVSVTEGCEIALDHDHDHGSVPVEVHGPDHGGGQDHDDDHGYGIDGPPGSIEVVGSQKDAAMPRVAPTRKLGVFPTTPAGCMASS